MKRLVHSYDNPDGGRWLRGNLHTHTTRSDGARPPQAVIDDYAARGYDFLMISDHDIFTSASDHAQWDARGMILIPGNEISRHGPHLLHVDGDRFLEPLASRQSVLNALTAAGRGFAVVNHPNWQEQFDHCTIAQMREWTGYVGLEIFNGVIGRLDGSPYATNKWDMLLAEGRRLWGFAHDDSHAATGDVALGWNVAWVTDKSVAGIVDALRRGRFYASTGVVIRSIRVEGLKIRIETENAERIVALQNVGKRFAIADDSAIEVTVPAKATYVRFECWGRGERFAWTQPFFVEDGNGDSPKGPADWIREWQASTLLTGTTLEQTSSEQARSLPRQPLRCGPPDHPALAGFLDLRQIIENADGVVYVSAELARPTACRETLRLGYDGPIRIWLNGQLLFDGPGDNPAIRDRLALYAPLRAGANELLIAFDSHSGKAWGLFARCS